MAGSAKGCLKGCAIGCGIVLVVGVVLLVVGGVSVMAPLNRAMSAREKLDAGHPSQEHFTPPIQGQALEERIQIFVGVRTQLMGQCPRFTEIEEAFLAMESFDGQDDVSRVDVMRQALATTHAAMGIAPAIGDFHELRNQTLLDHGMGLGEYTFLYLSAYHRQLDKPENRAVFDERIPNRRVRTAFIDMLRRQAEQAASELGESSTLSLELNAELEALEDDPGRLPWSEGEPTSLAAALAQHRQALEEVYCHATAPLELLVNRRRAVAIETF